MQKQRKSIIKSSYPQYIKETWKTNKKIQGQANLNKQYYKKLTIVINLS